MEPEEFIAMVKKAYRQNEQARKACDARAHFKVISGRQLPSSKISQFVAELKRTGLRLVHGTAH